MEGQTFFAAGDGETLPRWTFAAQYGIFNSRILLHGSKKKGASHMDCIGIIGEFDPFHRGHAHLIAQARKDLPGSPVVCAMSGAFTQRGEAAIASKYARAEMALRCGADLILELPVQWAVASAERFARGGVAVLAAAGATHLVFGSEAGALGPLKQAAEALDSPDFPAALQPYLKEGLPFATARQNALEQLIGAAAEVLTQPNNLLGIEYLRAIRLLAPDMEAVTVPRAGAAHNSAEGIGGLSSASALRALLINGALEQVCARVPEPAAEILRRERAENRCPAALAYNGRGIFTRLRSMTAADFAALPDCGEGLEHRILRAVGESVTLTECCDRVKTKRYAHARVRRLILRAYLGLTAADCPEQPPYLRVLGLTENGRAILRRAKALDRLPIVTKPAAVKSWDAVCQRQFAIDARTERLWNLCLPQLLPAPNEWAASPVVIKPTPSDHWKKR